mgnify:CR=1 FL=1
MKSIFYLLFVITFSVSLVIILALKVFPDIKNIHLSVEPSVVVNNSIDIKELIKLNESLKIEQDELIASQREVHNEEERLLKEVFEHIQETHKRAEDATKKRYDSVILKIEERIKNLQKEKK